jgi:hypothetical protein
MTIAQRQHLAEKCDDCGVGHHDLNSGEKV